MNKKLQRLAEPNGRLYLFVLVAFAAAALLLGQYVLAAAEGVVLLPLRVAKGLEFDHVIVPDAQAEVYPDAPLARRRLYTALSRAMHRVTVLAQGPLTPMLAER